MSLEIEKMKDFFDSSPFAKFMGMSLVELSKGFAKVQVTIKPEFLNWDDRIQGGVMSSILDQAFGCSINTMDRVYMAVQLSINIISTATAGEILVATSKVVHSGMSLGICEMELQNQQGKIIARALGTALSTGTRTQV